MGNESCKLKDLEVDKTAVEINNFWTLSNAVAFTSTNDDGKQYLSVFQGDTMLNTQLWHPQGPMEKVIRNLMIFRHPYILKYITNWEQSSHKCVATERVQPLQTVIMQQSDIQICLGLRTILCALIFLIEKAFARHLNICMQSIYVTETGNWRLAGFEFVWKSQDINKTIINSASLYRYEKAIDPSENIDTEEGNFYGIEQYAFATLCDEIFKQSAMRDKEQQQQHKVIPSIPHVYDFHEYCSNDLKHNNKQMRPKLSEILLHPYFNHEFVLIHAFLFELPLKSSLEKQNFFIGLIDRLRYFDENLVASQFANDLLSRMVLLDDTAQMCVTPFILRTKFQNNSALFSTNCYRKYLLPIILKMFRVRDAQIRLILLAYFKDFVQVMAPADVHEHILPYLKVGLSDTNELLVSKTLYAMAELVPILGAKIVLGSERIKLFSDGRPQGVGTTVVARLGEPRSITPVLGEHMDMEECAIVSGSPLPLSPEALLSKSGSFSSTLSQTFNSDTYEHCMPPRLSPDGGEDVKSTLTIDAKAECNTEEAIPNGKALDLKKHQSTFAVDENNLDKANVKVEDEEEAEWSDWDNEVSSAQQEKSAYTNNNANSENQRNKDIHIVTETSNATTGERLSDENIYRNLCKSNQSEISLSNSSYYTVQSSVSFASSQSSVTPNATITANKLQKINDDFSQLDIQVKSSTTAINALSAVGHPNISNELDFFKDMEPIIQSCKKYDLNVIKEETNQEQLIQKSKPSRSVDNTRIMMTNFLDTSDILIDAKRFAAFSTNEDNNVAGWNVDDDDLDISTAITMGAATPTTTTIT